VTTGARLAAVVERTTPRLQALTDLDAAEPTGPGKWSRKEILGHLIDSASNNHQRFVRAQFTGDLVFPGYRQEEWVAAQRYADAPWDELIGLWRGYNLHIARVIDLVPDDVAAAPRASHNLDAVAWRPAPKDEPVTLAWFMSDYVDHLEHHLSQIFPLD
jgi:hypothetical protein